MKCLSRLALAFASVALLASCAAATDATTKITNSVTVAAKRLMVELPKSLTTTSPSATGSFSRVAAVAAAPASIGYSMIQSTVTSAKSLVPMMAQYSVMVDAVVSQNNLTPSATPVTGKTLTITQGMLDQMKGSVDADLLDTTNLPAVGSTQPMPDFVYNTSANNHFNYTFTMTESSGGVSVTMTFYWNTDKSKFGMEMAMVGMMSMTVANDTATESTVMKITPAGSGAFTMKFKADDAAAAAHGVFVGMDAPMGPSSTMTIAGWADDNGGAVSFVNNSSTYTEEFTGAGVMSYQAYDPGTGAVVNYGTGATAAYTAKLGNTVWGDAPTFF